MRREHVADDLPGGQFKLPNSQCEFPVWVRAAEPYTDNPVMDADIPTSQRRTLLELSGPRMPVAGRRSQSLRFLLLRRRGVPGQALLRGALCACLSAGRGGDAARACSRVEPSSIIAASASPAARPSRNADGCKMGMKHRWQDPATSAMASFLVLESSSVRPCQISTNG